MCRSKYLLFAFGFVSMLFSVSCSSTTDQASATTEAAGYHYGKYYLTEAEKSLTAEELLLRIKEEARICADSGAAKFKLDALEMPVFQQKTPSSMSMVRAKAYNERLVELGSSPVDISAEIKAANASPSS